ncbi:MAG: EAL domain-containing protein [Alphaproteobacteria bacterium]|nr:EAL domain-containing protein [Alphaproteobacteria bacterium]
MAVDKTLPPSPVSSLADIVAASGHVGYHWDLETDQLAWFGPWQQLFGEACEKPPHNAQSLAAVIVPDDHYLVFSDGASVFDREYRVRRADGRVVWVAEHGTTDHESGRPVRQRGLLRIIDAPRQRFTPGTYFAHERDPLTGRLNRASMLAQIDRIMDGSKDVRQASAYMVIGIDNMAFVNEAVGTKAADILLSSVAGRLCQMSPLKAIVGRVYGDMFGILLPGLKHEAQPLAERILQSFRDRPVTTVTASVHITLSIGNVHLAGQPKDAHEIMVRAEQALSEARKRGRNHYIEYQESPTRAQENLAVLEIAERVKQALKQDKLRLAFQPIIEAETGRVLFYEALARLLRDDGSIMPAAEFIPIVEQQGLALELDRHVFNLALRELETYKDLSLAVNVSGLTAAQVDWPDYVQSILATRPDVARRLIIEITETAAIMDVGETKRLVESLNKLGAQVALDDFGAGATSIRHLRTLSLSIMKIDRELLMNLIGNSEQQHLVRMLIQIARGLGLKSIAEGVENEDVAQWLRQEKVDMMQGYYFGRPSLDRPWLDLKGAEAPEGRARTLFGTASQTGESLTPAQLHVASFVHV